MRVQSRGGNRYVFVIVDDYSRLIWTIFLATQDEIFDMFVTFVKKLQRNINSYVACIRFDHGTEFENVNFLESYAGNGIDHNFSSPMTLRQNGIVERKNRNLEDMARTMLIGSGLPMTFWAEVVNTACYIINRCMIRPIIDKTPYELLKGRKSNVTHLRTFSKCVEEIIHVIFDKSNLLAEKGTHVADNGGVFRKKLDDQGNITRNQTRLVIQGYNQEEGIDYDEIFSPPGKNGSNTHAHCLCIIQGFQTVSNRYEECLPKWGLKHSLLSVSQMCDKVNWVLFTFKTDETFDMFVTVVKKLQRNINSHVVCIRFDHGTEFENFNFLEFYAGNGIDHNFTSPMTLRKNGIVERKNRNLEDMARTMLISNGLHMTFRAEVVNTACYIINRCMIRPIIDKTPYELLKGRKPNVTHLRAFVSKCFVHNNSKEALGNFDVKNGEGVFLGYSLHSKAYKLYNKIAKCVEEIIHVIFDKSNLLAEKGTHVADNGEFGPDENNEERTNHELPEVASEQDQEPCSPKHFQDVSHIGGTTQENQEERVAPGSTTDLNSVMVTRSKFRNMIAFLALSMEEPKNIKEALGDAKWIVDIQEELNQFERNKVWHLVPTPKDRIIIGTRWGVQK
ncbi:uncharacterized protein LOC142168906 [Nicotiana tabacum]|uniref:Uncharacterized protein LOC142168906 n=1 Tax=Nicotiana tabacum TaxID=4097 RepID=A0AC58SMJ0_TOBAC